MKLRQHAINTNACFEADFPKLSPFFDFLLFFLVLGKVGLKRASNSVSQFNANLAAHSVDFCH